MSSVTRRLRRGLSAAAIATGLAVSFAGTASAAPASGVVIDNGQLTVTGTNRADNITLRVPATNTSVVEVDFGNGTAPRIVQRADFTQIKVTSRGGNDVVRIDYGAETQPFTIIDTGNGNDSAFGGSGNEVFRTGNGNDFVDGNRGADTAFLGNGSDTFVWDPGDGSDVIEGGRGPDTMLFNGAAIAERFAATANGPRLRFTRDVGNIVMDTDNVERVKLNALGGADSVSIGDLRGTDVRELDIDLGAQINTSGGDSAVDAVTVTGTPGKDHIRVSGSGGDVRVSGLSADVRLSDVEPADQLTVDTLTGNDRVSTNRLAPGTISLTIL
ncbi:calcium-binding protein [Kribbella sp. NPDC050124]|uniref:calcium-binding protein n=1 Tax=Kribbella sp. NPDC050124 TaxID=3364114 RepID=UPI003791D8B0